MRFAAAGDVNRFFERVTTDEEYAKYNITVHSRDPWLITFDDFISVSTSSCVSKFIS